jgi:hypothetical protein
MAVSIAFERMSISRFWRERHAPKTRLITANRPHNPKGGGGDPGGRKKNEVELMSVHNTL